VIDPIEKVGLFLENLVNQRQAVESLGYCQLRWIYGILLPAICKALADMASFEMNA